MAPFFNMAVLVAATAGVALAWPQCLIAGKGHELQVIAGPRQQIVDPGDEITIDLALRNPGDDPLQFYHPPSIHMVSSCSWSLAANVTRPDGREFTLAPEITSALAAHPSNETVRTLAPGDEIVIPFHIGPDDPTATHSPSGWVGLIPISRSEYEMLPEAVVKAAHGVRGEVFFISGSNVRLALRDPLVDIFNVPGKYVLHFEYANACARSLNDEIGKLWTGELSAEIEITVADPGLNSN